MFRMFNRTETGPQLPDEPRFTRFEDRSGKRNLEGAKPKFTRFSASETTLTPRASTPDLIDLLAEDNAARQAAPAQSQPTTPEINHTAHLHADDHIPLWVIRKALPKRFATMNADEDTFDFR